jgi:hypothetical protein
MRKYYNGIITEKHDMRKKKKDFAKALKKN